MWASKGPPAALVAAQLLLAAAAAPPASGRALTIVLGPPTEARDVEGEPVLLPSDAARKPATSLPTDVQGEPVLLPSDAEKWAATGQPPAGSFGEPPAPPAPPADRQAERDRKLQAILAGLKPEDVIAALTGRGPCTQGTAVCRVRPCAPSTGDASGEGAAVCPDPLFCLDDYCGGCNHICATEEQLRQAVDIAGGRKP